MYVNVRKVKLDRMIKSFKLFLLIFEDKFLFSVGFDPKA